MKNLFKFIFIFLTFFTTLCPSVQSAEFCSANFYAPTIVNLISGEVVYEKIAGEDFSIVAVNSGKFEISAINERKDTFVNGSLDRGCAQNKFLQQIFSSRYNQTFISKSHNISSYLKNEICTRAP